MAIIEISRSNKGHKQERFVPYVSVSKSKNGPETQIIFSVNRYAMKELRWVTGDRVKVVFDDESHLITLTRISNNGGYTLSGKSKSTRAHGLVASASIRVTTRGIIKPTEFTAINKDDCVIEGTSITFVMPGQS